MRIAIDRASAWRGTRILRTFAIGELGRIKQATADVKKAIKDVQGIANIVTAVRSLPGIADTIIGVLT